MFWILIYLVLVVVLYVSLRLICLCTEAMGNKEWTLGDRFTAIGLSVTVLFGIVAFIVLSSHIICSRINKVWFSKIDWNKKVSW